MTVVVVCHKVAHMWSEEARGSHVVLWWWLDLPLGLALVCRGAGRLPSLAVPAGSGAGMQSWLTWPTGSWSDRGRAMAIHQA
jgi:hypothetical protein